MILISRLRLLSVTSNSGGRSEHFLRNATRRHQIQVFQAGTAGCASVVIMNVVTIAVMLTSGDLGVAIWMMGQREGHRWSCAQAIVHRRAEKQPNTWRLRTGEHCHACKKMSFAEHQFSKYLSSQTASSCRSAA